MLPILLRLKNFFKQHLLIILGWFFVLLGIIGILLPVLPTTPFLLLASALFSKSSPRFHRMLLNNAWFGPIIQQWEANKTLSRKIKYRASFLIISIFSISIVCLEKKLHLQLLLIGIAFALLFFLWRIREQPE
ncbi:MAG: YbaN family protein [Candidatus Electrothrix sp. GW3-4]|uniref:YbaN family protein n=1 Tax=Candidatus Electrothrix sp. GW3-4 TaxID=3126740 RepID=UPI0030CEA1AE